MEEITYRSPDSSSAQFIPAKQRQRLNSDEVDVGIGDVEKSRICPSENFNAFITGLRVSLGELDISQDDSEEYIVVAGVPGAP